MTPAGRAGSQPLVVNLLGPPRVCWNGLPLEIPRRQPRALLYYLTVHLLPVSRDQLCYLLWPDEGEMHARRRLSRLLNELRRTLLTDALLITSEEQISLNAAHIRSDTRTFMHLYGEDADRAPANALEAAVDFYRGEFLAGFDLPNHPEFDLWLAQILPEVWEEPSSPLHVPLASETGQTRLLEALDRLLLGWSRPGRPVILCLDDLHWADEATYAWRAYLKRRLAGEAALAVGAYRAGAEHVASAPRETTLYVHSLARLRHALARNGVLTELGLEGLDRASTRQLVAALLLDEGRGATAQRIEVHEPLVARLQEWSGGNPLLQVELLQDLLCAAGDSAHR